MIKIYERKHIFGRISDVALCVMGIVVVVLLFLVSIGAYGHKTYDSIFLDILGFLFGIVGIPLFVYVIYEIYKNYKNLVIDKNPVITIEDDSITLYNSRKNYVTLKWEDIKGFDYWVIPRSGKILIHPEFKDKETAKKYNVKKGKSLSIEAQYLEVESDDLLSFLNGLAKGICTEERYYSLKRCK